MASFVHVRSWPPKKIKTHPLKGFSCRGQTRRWKKACEKNDRCIEIIAFALPVWRCAQVAIDTTFVSPIGRERPQCQRSRKNAEANGPA